MTMETSKLIENMSIDSLSHERVFEGSMIANEIYQDAVYDESGLLYTKLALSNYQKNPQKSQAYASESLHYIQKKLAHQNEEVKATLEKLEKIIALIKDQEEADVAEGTQEVQTLSELINKNLVTARAKYLQTLKTH